MLDTTIHSSLYFGGAVCVLTPVVHVIAGSLLLARVPSYVSFLVAMAVLGAAILAAPWALPAATDAGWLDVLTVELGLLAFAVGYVEFWFLLDRGYTLNLIVLLVRMGSAARIETLKERYGGDRGLEWLFRKRLKGMMRVGLIDTDEKTIRLTPVVGALTARISRWCISSFGAVRQP